MASNEEILRIVKEKGPLIPNDIKKIIGGDTFLISAILSEMVADKILRISHTKIGGSPTYYSPGQEFKLQDLRKYLNEKDQRTFDKLKQKLIIRDKDEDPLVRVSLRNIKDFAKQLEVSVQGETEIFWKWYQAPKDEVEKRIRALFSKSSPKKETKPIEKKPVLKKEPKKEEKKTIEKEEKKEKVEKKTELKKVDDTNSFMSKLNDYFEEKNIEVLDRQIIRKNSDIELEISIPTAVGKVKYFCKAKKKKKCNDGDLSSAYISGHTRKLPVIFITTGDITKKAQNKLETEFKGLVVKKL